MKPKYYVVPPIRNDSCSIESKAQTRTLVQVQTANKEKIRTMLGSVLETNPKSSVVDSHMQWHRNVMKEALAKEGKN